MSIDKKIQELETIAKIIESEKSFDKTMEHFTKAATLVKEIMEKTKNERGRITEIIKDVEGTFERALEFDGDGNCDD